jgi:hypothetical protein
VPIPLHALSTTLLFYPQAVNFGDGGHDSGDRIGGDRVKLLAKAPPALKAPLFAGQQTTTIIYI